MTQAPTMGRRKADQLISMDEQQRLLAQLVPVSGLALFTVEEGERRPSPPRSCCATKSSLRSPSRPSAPIMCRTKHRCSSKRKRRNASYMVNERESRAETFAAVCSELRQRASARTGCHLSADMVLLRRDALRFFGCCSECRLLQMILRFRSRDPCRSLYLLGVVLLPERVRMCFDFPSLW